jgi:hypothetical protein
VGRHPATAAAPVSLPLRANSHPNRWDNTAPGIGLPAGDGSGQADRLAQRSHAVDHDATVPLPTLSPVFVDPSGRRRQTVRWLAIAGCGLLGGYSVLVLSAMLGAPLPSSAMLPQPGRPQPSPPAATAASTPGPALNAAAQPRPADTVALRATPAPPAALYATGTTATSATATVPSPTPHGLARRGITNAPGKSLH